MRGSTTDAMEVKALSDHYCRGCYRYCPVRSRSRRASRRRIFSAWARLIRLASEGLMLNFRLLNSLKSPSLISFLFRSRMARSICSLTTFIWVIGKDLSFILRLRCSAIKLTLFGRNARLILSFINKYGAIFSYGVG